MFRSFVFVLSVISALGAGSPLWAQVTRSGLIPETTALRHGLTRAWFIQVQLDRAKDRVTHVQLIGKTLFVQTDAAMVQSIDAETGKSNWAEQIGVRHYPSLPVSANNDSVAVINGSTLYMVSRKKGVVPRKKEMVPRKKEMVSRKKGMAPLRKGGFVQWEERLVGVARTGPAMSKQRVYIPKFSGLVTSYFLDEHINKPWSHASHGTIVSHPLSVKHGVSWATDQGYLFLNRANRDDKRIKILLDDGGAIVAPISYRKPYYFAATTNGFAYSISENGDEPIELFSYSEPIYEQPVAFGKFVYIIPKNSGMFQIEIHTGKEKWWTPRPVKFISASKTKVYAVDRIGRLHILDISTGGTLGTIPTERLNVQLTNTVTDRVYLGTEDGLIQCLHEIALKEPIRFDEPKKGEGKTKEKKKAGEEVEGDPFEGDDGGEKPGKVKDDDPFAGDDEGGDEGGEVKEGVKEDPFGEDKPGDAPDKDPFAQ